MTRWRLIRSLVRGIPFFLAELIIGLSFDYFLTNPDSDMSRGIGQIAMLCALTVLGFAVLGYYIGDIIQQPVSWRGYTKADFSAETQVKRLTRKLCNQRQKLQVSLPISRDCRLQCIYPSKRRIFTGFRKFVLYGRAPMAYLSFTFEFPAEDPEVTQPEDQIYFVMFFGGSHQGSMPDADGKLHAANFEWLIEQLTVAVEQFTRQLGRPSQV